MTSRSDGFEGGEGRLRNFDVLRHGTAGYAQSADDHTVRSLERDTAAERGEAAVAKLHFPGLHPDAARWLVANRPIKAIGIDNRRLLGIVFVQAFVAAGLGFAVGVGIAYGTAALVERLFPEMMILIEPSGWLRQVPVLAVIVALAAFSPVRRVMRLDPMLVFQA